MKISKEITKVEKQPIFIYCNMCGKEIEKKGVGTFDEFLDVHKKWDYLSNYDGQTHSFDLCQDCYQNIINQFKIPVDKTVLQLYEKIYAEDYENDSYGQ